MEASLSPDSIPPAIRGLAERLRASACSAHLVGGCVRDLVQGRSARDFDLATDAQPERVLEIFPRAIPTGLRHGTVMVPTLAGPVDVTTYRGGPKLEEDLALRDFTINAMAYDPIDDRLSDPCGGQNDLASGLLRCVGSAEQRLNEDPLRALRAARFHACLSLTVDPELESAMGGQQKGLAGVAAERLRRELELLLLGRRAGSALGLLRRTGLEAVLASRTREDAGAVVDALPATLELRLAGWLRGARASAALRRLRFPRRMGDAVAHLLELHPVEDRVDPGKPASLRRLLGRRGDSGVEALFALGDAELAVHPDEPRRARLSAVREAVLRLQRSGALALRRSDLALRGADVMEILRAEPGPRVGRALDWLTQAVLDDPACNERESLRKILLAWQERDEGHEG